MNDPKSIAKSFAYSVRAVERREAVEISERKKSIIGILGNVAELGASRMEETIGSASLRDAAIGTGIAVDKVLALTGQTPAFQIANIVMPSEEERAEMRAADAKLDEITAKLKACKPEPWCAHTRPSVFLTRAFYFSSCD